MNMLFHPITKLVGAATIILFVLGYMKLLVAEKDALAASVELYKRQAEVATITANDNAKKYSDLQYRYDVQNKELVALQKSIDKIKEEQHSSEKEIVKYVQSLPEGFEKSCLNMSVPSSVSGVSIH